MTMASQPARQLTFGAELRFRRVEKGLSLAGLADSVNYSKSHLSKIESGAKAPSTALARQCDRVLGASGALARLVPPRSTGGAAPLADAPRGVWTMWMAADGSGEFHAFDPATPPASASARVMRWAMNSVGDRGEPVELDLAVFRSLLRELRTLGQSTDPAAVFQIAVSLTNVVSSLATNAPPASRAPAYQLAARFAEYSGWMAQETGDDAAAMWWTNHAVILAASGGDRQMESYALVRRAEIALYREDSVGVLALAHRAQENGAGKRVQAFAVQREAQGHALAGDELPCRRALERATALMDRADAEGDAGHADQSILGSATMSDPVAFVTGWCLQDLGHSGPAAEILAAEFDRIPAHAHRVRARYGARLALALASEQEIDRACTVSEAVIAAMKLVDSATVRTDIRHLVRSMNRRRRHPGVELILSGLASTLHTDRRDRPIRAALL
jgi:transcriptional regulator with XRE-family HTH domain